MSAASGGGCYKRFTSMVLGQWQAIYLCEFDGPRERTVQVQVVAGVPS